MSSSANLGAPPFGFIKRYDPLTGYDFYVNIYTGTSQWTFPRASAYTLSEMYNGPNGMQYECFDPEAILPPHGYDNYEQLVRSRGYDQQYQQRHPYPQVQDSAYLHPTPYTLPFPYPEQHQSHGQMQAPPQPPPQQRQPQPPQQQQQQQPQQPPPQQQQLQPQQQPQTQTQQQQPLQRRKEPAEQPPQGLNGHGLHHTNSHHNNTHQHRRSSARRSHSTNHNSHHRHHHRHSSYQLQPAPSPQPPPTQPHPRAQQSSSQLRPQSEDGKRTRTKKRSSFMKEYSKFAGILASGLAVIGLHKYMDEHEEHGVFPQYENNSHNYFSDDRWQHYNH
ncbi:hypothetical protein H4R20_003459 [Coemansia guatemalensis]|uniref:WW domain-containing protein n=1 Tax=Coemansia guatemalensis TaxID=2761395 RepID=A0A9W8LRD3_9FUNG|nr:hypothetical protein H4R20_003459 [Coemansia guatemalensis]